jgi:hypothetical protein
VTSLGVGVEGGAATAGEPALVEVAVAVAEVIRAVVAESEQEAAVLVVAHTVGAAIKVVAAAEAAAAAAEILTAAETVTAKMGIMGAETIMTTEVDTETATGTVMAPDTVLVTGTEASWPFSSDSMDGISRRWF